jgi:AcrR family transcriptional regulator
MLNLLSGDATAVEDSDSTESKILSAALQLFNEFGLRRTSMDDIARRAGLGRATIYRRYADKDALVKVAMLREGRKFLDEIRAEIDHYNDREEAMIEGFALVVIKTRNHTLFQRLMVSEPETILPYLTLNGAVIAMMARFYFQQLLEEERLRGLKLVGNLDAMSEMVTRLFHSLVLTHSSAQPGEDKEHLRRLAHDLLIRFM